MTATYATAQSVVDSHPVDLAGRCRACIAQGPCEHRRQALAVLAERGELPRRWPGATRPELLGAPRVGFHG